MALGPSSGEGPAPAAAVFESVPLFPLPNVVLFPRAVLPLHVFEERYKAMTADALAGRRKVAMALLCTGWDNYYYVRTEIDPIVRASDYTCLIRMLVGKLLTLLHVIASS